ncbi:MAG: hypothetical protein E7532_02095 [Ruminococcaceae bacterium]|nr:hypothetical protein [Oscillospiraceae bacterium]
MKKLIALLMVVILGVSLCACAGSDSDSFGNTKEIVYEDAKTFVKDHIGSSKATLLFTDLEDIDITSLGNNQWKAHGWVDKMPYSGGLDRYEYDITFQYIAKGQSEVVTYSITEK